VHILSISIVELLADLLGEGEVNVLAARGSQLGDALLMLLNSLLNLRDSDTLLSSKILTADSDQVNRLVNTTFDGLREGNLDGRLNHCYNGDIIASLLGNLLAVVVAIAVVSVSRGRLAHSHHLGVTLLLKGNLHSLGSGVNNPLIIRVDTDLIGDDLNRLTADCTGHRVALFNINDSLHRDINVLTNSFKSRGAHLSCLNNLNNRTVVLGGMVGRGSMVSGSSMVGWGSMVSWSMMDYWSSMVGRGRVICWSWGVRGWVSKDVRGWICRASSCKRDDADKGKELKFSIG
jgi:hypothetical protein